VKKLSKRQRIFLAFVIATFAANALAWALDAAWIFAAYLLVLIVAIVIEIKMTK
jgi:hypothetical protein